MDSEDIQTLGEAQNFIVDGMHEAGGVLCPCCNQRVKLYKRSLNSSMARMLIALSKINNGRDWTYIEDWREQSGLTLNGGGDYGKLAYWELIQQKELEPHVDKGASGLWRITSKGIDFVNKNIKVPSHVLIYNNEIMGWSDKQVDITHCLGKKFSYDEIMDEV